MQPVPEEWNGFCYVYEGQGEISGHKAAPQQVGRYPTQVLTGCSAHRRALLSVAEQTRRHAG